MTEPQNQSLPKHKGLFWNNVHFPLVIAAGRGSANVKVKVRDRILGAVMV
jgi:hypothetical protein